MENQKKDRVLITELFMAQADRDRKFYGTIKRETDSSGYPVVRGKIKVLDGFILAMADNQDLLGSRLDTLVKLVLDWGLHSDADETTKICNTDFFLN